MLPDNWEQQHGLDADNPSGRHGADGDFDCDGITNYAEFLAGTNPLVFEIEGCGIQAIDVGAAGDTIELTFPVVGDRQYRVLYSSDLENWMEASTIPILTGNPNFVWTDDGSLTGEPPFDTDRRQYKVEIAPLSP